MMRLRKEFEMTVAKKKILEANGYKVTDSADWLGLSKEEAQIIDMRVALVEDITGCVKDWGYRI